LEIPVTVPVQLATVLEQLATVLEQLETESVNCAMSPVQ